MYIDNYLSWNYHTTCTKLSRANGILSKLRHNVPLETCLQVCYAIFYLHLIYGCNIWGHTSEEILHKIEVLQKKCLKIITFSDFNSHTNSFVNLKLLKVKYLIKLHQLKLVFEFYEQVIPTDLFTFSTDMHTTNLVLGKTFFTSQLSRQLHMAIDLWNFIVLSYGMTPLKKGIAIDGFVKIMLVLANFITSHILKWHSKTFSLQLHSGITIYYIRRCTLFITLFINYLIPLFFPLPFSPFCICPTNFLFIYLFSS